MLFTAHIDDRSGLGVIASRLGLQRQAATFDAHTDFWALLSGPQRGSGAEPIACVLIDESQFLTPAQVRQLHRLANTVGLPIICFGLRSDFMGQPFPGSAHLLTLGDDIEEIKTICACGKVHRQWYDTRDKIIRDLDAFGTAVYLEFKIRQIDLLNEIGVKRAKGLEVHIATNALTPTLVGQLENIFTEFGGATPLYLKLHDEKENINVDLLSRKFRIKPVNDMVKKMKKLPEVKIQVVY